MGSGTTIKYEQIPTAVNNMNDISRKMGEDIKAAYDKVRQMQSTTWYGKRYNDFTTYFNSYIDDPFVKILNYLVTEIPEFLKTWHINVSNFESVSPMNVSVEITPTIEPISPASTTGMFIEPNGVEQDKTEVLNRLNAVVDAIPNYINCVDILEWSGPTANEFNTIMQTSKTNLENTVESIKTTFSNEIQNAIDDRNALERSGGGL